MPTTPVTQDNLIPKLALLHSGSNDEQAIASLFDFVKTINKDKSLGVKPNVIGNWKLRGGIPLSTQKRLISVVIECMPKKYELLPSPKIDKNEYGSNKYHFESFIKKIRTSKNTIDIYNKDNLPVYFTHNYNVVQNKYSVRDGKRENKNVEILKKQQIVNERLVDALSGLYVSQRYRFNKPESHDKVIAQELIHIYAEKIHLDSRSNTAKMALHFDFWYRKNQIDLRKFEGVVEQSGNSYWLAGVDKYENNRRRIACITQEEAGIDDVERKYIRRATYDRVRGGVVLSETAENITPQNIVSGKFVMEKINSPKNIEYKVIADRLTKFISKNDLIDAGRTSIERAISMKSSDNNHIMGISQSTINGCMGDKPFNTKKELMR